MINYMIVSFYMLCQILLSIIVTTVNYEPPFFFLYSLFTGLFITAEKGLKKGSLSNFGVLKCLCTPGEDMH